MTFSQSPPIAIALSVSAAIHFGVLFATGGIWEASDSHLPETLIHLRMVTLEEPFEKPLPARPVSKLEPLPTTTKIRAKKPAGQTPPRKLDVGHNPASYSIHNQDAINSPDSSTMGRSSEGFPNIALNNYAARLLAHLENSQQYPELLRKANIEGKAVARLELDRSGKLVRASILSSSGMKQLDEEIIRLVERLAPYPSFPAEIESQSLVFSLPIRLRLNRPELLRR